MRGFLFEIANNMKGIGNLTADDFACTRDGGSFAEWYEDMDRDDVLAQMEPAAIEHGIVYGQECGVPYVVFSQVSKKSWFAERSKKFMEIAKGMTLESFASGDVHLCQRKIEDIYDDAVYLEESAITMDEFVRQAEPGKKYYIGNIIGMH